ncbi:MAG: 50S ribosome-binding GTPase, partial [Bacteroidales bacterium]|nr:50S ribosome-binding GTPase [Bacteroidales bacterium]
IRAELVEIASLVELELDFSEEDVQFADREKLDLLLSTAAANIRNLAQSFRLGNAIKNGVPVAIVGATNVGKSTLLNTILGEERAIVTDIHRTTRDTIEETVTIDGIMFRFIDTAGLRDSSETVEKIGIERTLSKVADAEVILGLIDGSLPEQELKSQAELITSLTLNNENQDIYLIVNKSDLSNAANTIENKENDGCNKNVHFANYFVTRLNNQTITPYFISAKTGAGVDGLLRVISAKFKGRIDNSQTAVTITNLRHFEALRNAEGELNKAREALAENIPSDLLADDIRNAISALGEIVGEITTTDILSSIFANFCIGK